MNCDQALEAISAALDGELSPGERAELSKHLLQCEHCRRVAEDFRVLAGLLEDSEVQVPEGLAASVCAAAAREAQEAPAPRRRRPYLSAIAAMLALCVGLGGISLFVSGQAEKGQNFTGGTAMYRTDSVAGEPYCGNDEAEGADSGDNGSCPQAPMDDPAMPNAVEALPAEPSLSMPTPDAAGSLTIDREVEPPLPGDKAGQSPPEEPGFYSFQNAQVIRVTWGATPSAPAARIVGSTASLEEFIAQFPEDDLSALLDTYGGSYFSASRLLAVVVEEGSGSISHSIAPQGLRRDQVEVLRTVPEVGTDDMAAWLLLAEVDTMFEDGDTLSVVFTDS